MSRACTCGRCYGCRMAWEAGEYDGPPEEPPEPEDHWITYRDHDIHLTRDLGKNWYIVVADAGGFKCYDGYWRDSSTKTVDEALDEAKAGSLIDRATTTKEAQ